MHLRAGRDWVSLVAALVLSLVFAVRGMAPLLVPGEVVQDDMRQWIV